MNSNTYKLLFKDTEKEALEMDDLRTNLFKGRVHNQENIDYVKNAMKFIKGYEKDYFEFEELNDSIHCLTSKMFRNYKKEYIKKMENLNIVKSVVEEKENFYIVDTIDGKIEFTTIENIFPPNNMITNIFQDSEYLKHYYNKIANYDRRIQKCHSFGVYVAHLLEEFFETPNEVVTGYTCYSTEKSKFLHTWNEFEKNGKQYVLDSTFNVVMNKEGYYLLRHIEQVINKIDSKNVISDFEKYEDIIEKFGLKTYLTCRDELIRDLDKNFNKTNEGEER